VLGAPDAEHVDRREHEEGESREIGDVAHPLVDQVGADPAADRGDCQLEDEQRDRAIEKTPSVNASTRLFSLSRRGRSSVIREVSSSRTR